MKIIMCVDDHMGMIFNHRRQSKDREIKRDMLSFTRPALLWMNAYSKEQFGDNELIRVAENFLIRAGEDDYCFIENGQYLIDESKIKEIVLYKWNRVYPADVFFSIDLTGWTLADISEFKGFSHDKITREVYVR